jgi:hypothetical protein
MAVVIIWIAPHTPAETLLAGLLSCGVYAMALLAFDVAGSRQIAVRILRTRYFQSRSVGELL